jgi:hypothetical protein
MMLLAAFLFITASQCKVLAVPSAEDNFELYFGPHSDHTKTIDNFFIKLVDSAQTSIDGAFFEFRFQSIVDAFTRAHQRGVKIRFVTDTDYYPNEFTAALVKAGIKVKQDNRSALMHNKFMVVDSDKIWTGSYNLTNTCSYNNNNNALCIFSKELCEIYQREFDEMFVNGQFGAKSPSTVEMQKNELTIMGQKTTVEVYFAPEDNPNQRVFELMKQAKNEIYFMQFAFTSDKISDILVEKAISGVNVSGIFDTKLYRASGPYSEFYKLTSADANVILANNPNGKLHHKVFIVDPSSDDGFVITGSENCSDSGNNSNDENIMIIHNNKVAQAYLNEFKKLQGYFSNSYATCMNVHLKPGQEVQNLNILFNANGHFVDKVEIEYPARWKFTGNEKFSLLISGPQDISRGSIKFNKKSITITNLGLKPFGKSSFAIFNFKNLLAPQIKGGYNFYVKCSGDILGKTIPIKSQPGIKVSDSVESVYSIDELLKKMHVAYSEMLIFEQNSSNTKMSDDLFSDWKESYDEISQAVLSTAANGNYKNVDKFLELYARLNLKNKPETSDFIDDLKSILEKNASSEDEEALKMIERLNSILTGPSENYENINTVQKIRADSIAEYINNNPGENKEFIDAYTTKISSDENEAVYIADVVKTRSDNGTEKESVKIKTLTAYKVIVGAEPSISKISIATIREKLSALEINYMKYRESKKDANSEEYKKFELNSNRMFYSIINELKKNTPDAAANFDGYIEYVKSKRVPEISGFEILTKNLRDKLKWDLAVCVKIQKPQEVVKLINNYHDKIRDLYQIIINSISAPQISIK